MNEIVMAGAKGSNGIWIIRASLANRMNMVKLDPALVPASFPLGIYEGASSTIASHYSVFLRGLKSLAYKSLGYYSSWEEFALSGLVLVML